MTPAVETPVRSHTRRPDLDTVFTINPDGSRNFLHLADVRGRWQVRKTLVYWILIAVYVALPFIRIGGEPAVHLDLPGRSAQLFGHSFTNQDFYLVFFLVTGLGFGLFVVTSLFGRIWCGYACPQTVFLEAIYRRVERFLEGSREKRLRRNAGPMSAGLFIRKAVKHALYLGFSLAIAHVFLAYFIPVEKLVHVIRNGPAGHWAVFGWTMFWTAVIYFDNAWFREQTCLVLCPYGRMQSALIDDDTIIIGYDERRGEPRSKKTGEGGDCVDCYRCVVVCPTGIDIRRGLQMECVGCANCIDACDEVMAKLHRPPGLIRYDSKRGFAGLGRRVFRPRVVIYTVLGLAGVTIFSLMAQARPPFEVHVLRPRGLPFELVENDIRNLYTLSIQNKGEQAAAYALSAQEPATPGVRFIISQESVAIGGLADAKVPVFALLPRDEYQGPFPMHFTVRDEKTGVERTVEVTFRGP
jgi:cytochrome c oxidase accessory protein FixG